jgi:hypothetical protein
MKVKKDLIKTIKSLMRNKQQSKNVGRHTIRWLKQKNSKELSRK